MWPYRTELENRKVFGGQTYRDVGKPWHEYGQIPVERAKIPLSIVFAFVATHNHFVFDRGGKVFKQTAPVIKLPATAAGPDYLALAGSLNSSTGCFWMKQTLFSRGGGGIGGGIAAESWERFYEHDGTKLKQFPLPTERPLALARQLDALAHQLAEQQPARLLERWQQNLTQSRKDAKSESLCDFAALRELLERTRRQMIALQEDLDWQCYRLYGLLADDLCGFASLREVRLGERAFEIVLARKMRDEGLQTTWFTRHGSTPTTETHDPLTLRRIAAIESNPQIALIEQPEYKRRWNDKPWEEKVTTALHAWLLDRLESYFDFDGRMQDLTQRRKDAKQDGSLGVFAPLRELSLCSVAKVADLAARDPAFQTVAELYRGRPDFDVVKLVTELVEAESVPLLPILRYKPSGLDKRRAWERTWELQRQEDAIDQRVMKQDLGVNADGWKAATDDGKSPLNLAQADLLKKEKVGPIPPPPKYKSADFQSSTYWRLRGSLDVPKERWVSFPHCEGAERLPLIAWAGYDHLQLAKAIAAHYVHVLEQEGGRDDPRLVPLLAGLIELLPWLKQWHNEIDAEYNRGLGDYFEGFLQDEARQMGRTMDDVRNWQPPAKKNSRKAAKTQRKKEG